jgi:hypothetical protein
LSPSIPPYSLIRAHGKGWTALGPQGIQSRPGFVSSFIQNINYMQAYFGIMDVCFSHLLELVSAAPYLPGCHFAAYRVTQGYLLDVVRPKTRRRHSLQHAAPHQDSSHVLACVSQCKMICECNIPRYLITQENPPRSHKRFGIIPRHPSCQAQQHGKSVCTTTV